MDINTIALFTTTMIRTISSSSGFVISRSDLSAGSTAISTLVELINIPSPTRGITLCRIIVRGIPTADDSTIGSGITRRECTCQLIFVASMSVSCIFLATLILLSMIHSDPSFVPILLTMILLFSCPPRITCPCIGEKEVIVIVMGMVIGSRSLEG